MASGRNRANRPDTQLLLTKAQIISKYHALLGPSSHAIHCTLNKVPLLTVHVGQIELVWLDRGDATNGSKEPRVTDAA
jgi:predicted ATP-grasp superfamily ATP-dependent carboligase